MLSNGSLENSLTEKAETHPGKAGGHLLGGRQHEQWGSDILICTPPPPQVSKPDAFKANSDSFFANWLSDRLSLVVEVPFLTQGYKNTVPFPKEAFVNLGRRHLFPTHTHTHIPKAALKHYLHLCGMNRRDGILFQNGVCHYNNGQKKILQFQKDNFGRKGKG